MPPFATPFIGNRFSRETSEGRYLALAVLVLFLFDARQAAAIPILESATLGPTGEYDVGFAIESTTFLGARFQVNQTVAVNYVGGVIDNLKTSGNGELFAAIVSLASSTALPSDGPSTFTPLAYTVFTPPSTSADILVPLSVTLGPGEYGLVFWQRAIRCNWLCGYAGGST